MKKIIFKDFRIDSDIIAPKIYSWVDRQISNKWIEVSPEIREELSEFLEAYIKYLWMKWKKTFFRIDSYFDNNRLYILDINASFVDWWWNGLNFLRSVWGKVDNLLLWNFPAKFFLLEEQYRPEFELCIRELNNSLWDNTFWEIDSLNSQTQTYVYWNTSQISENIFPFNWVENDDKIKLAIFSQAWKWDLVKIPNFILPWDEPDYSKLSDNIVLKIASKNNIRSDWRNKVIVWKPKKWKDWQKNWEAWILVAQEIVNPSINDWLWNSQAIILTSWVNAITWYVQNSTKNIINDNSIQSPLIFKK